MFTLGVVYIFIYITIIVSLLIITNLALPFNLLTQQSISFFSVFLQKYTKYKLPFYLLIFSLTGLPPMGLFFVKFNIFIYIVYQTHLLLIISLFLIFFCNMLYYIQLFNVKNFKKKMYSQVYSMITQDWHNTQLLQLSNNYDIFTLIYLVSLILTILILYIYIYSDLFFIFNL